MPIFLFAKIAQLFNISKLFDGKIIKSYVFPLFLQHTPTPTPTNIIPKKSIAVHFSGAEKRSKRDIHPTKAFPYIEPTEKVQNVKWINSGLRWLRY